MTKPELIIFDLDGVITSEEIYWHVSAATTRFILADKGIDCTNYLDIGFIKQVKAAAINSNWDLTYINTALHLLGNSAREEFIKLAERHSGQDLIEQIYILADKDEYYKNGGELWQYCYQIFQEKLENGSFEEKPAIEPAKITDILQQLTLAGYKLGIATGRPYNEAKQALEQLGLFNFFDKNHIATFDDVAQEQKQSGGAHKGKPDPFQLIKAKGSAKTCIMVGDTASDINAAIAAKMPVVAVLSGAFDQNDRQQKKALFESLKADYIIEDITELQQCLQL